MSKLITFIFLMSFTSNFCQSKFYNFNLYDGKAYLSTMNLSNDLMLNTLRYIGNEIYSRDLSKREKKLYSSGLSLFTAILGQAITHEEGHHSVLAELGIGSISDPFIDKNLVAKVIGVTDATLINLRNNDLPNYIRLHTGGLESDYAYLKKADGFFNFKEEKNEILYPDYFVRRIGVQFYFITTFFSLKSSIKETDEAELNRDIVGHDLYGMIRHLHRPSMGFYRYTTMSDLTSEEKNYGKRMGFMSLFNLLNPNIWNGKGYELFDNMKGNFSVNYSLAPFGDFIEQNAYLTIKNKYKINPYFRQYFNKSYTFFAAGFNLQNYVFYDSKYLLNLSLDLWSQPENFEFRTKNSEFGFGVKSDLAIRFTSWNENNKSAYFNIGTSYKTKGFIPESPSLKEDFRIHLGFVLSIKNNNK